jgi:hypothetical protein
MKGLCQKCMSLVEDIVILLPGEAGGICKARTGDLSLVKDTVKLQQVGNQ